MVRDDVPRIGLAPDHIQSFLRRKGGKNPYGEDMYRLVRAELVRELEGGCWHDWDESLSIQQRGGYIEDGEGNMSASPHQPNRVVAEMRWVERYPNMTGWAIQKWHPRSKYGTKEAWESKTVKGHPDLFILGPFPIEGRYELLISETMEEIPDTSSLGYIIDMAEHLLAKNRERASTAEARIRIAEYEQMRRMEMRKQKAREVKLQKIKDRMSPYMGSSLAAGRMRTALAEKAGIRSHVGN